MKSKTCIDITKAVDCVIEKADIFNRHSVDNYLSGTGLAVDTAYCGVGNRL